MQPARRNRPAADVTLAYAADAKGSGVAYAVISTGSASRTVRLTFSAASSAVPDGRECGYAAVAEIAHHLKARGFGRVRIRLADARMIGDLSGRGAPPPGLAMAYVRTRCLLRSLGSVRLEIAETLEIRDLAARALAEVSLHAAA